jgi:hypothetical protein
MNPSTQPGNHLDQLIRQTRAHHVQLSSMADLKANMLLTMASIVVTLAAPQAMRAGSQWSLLVLITFSLITILLAAYAVMPKLPLHLGPIENSTPDVKSPGFNLLFFGDFTRLTYDEFSREMNEAMADPQRSYELQLREIYTLGQFLAQTKYRYLRLAYATFITGLLLSFLTLLFTGHN